MAHPLITAESISFQYPGAASPAYQNVSFSLGRGELLCLAGVNGSGKSSLLYTLAGLYSPTSGRLVFCPAEKEDRDDDQNQLSDQGKTVDPGKAKSRKKAESRGASRTAESLRQSAALVVQQAEAQIIGGTVREDIDLTCNAFNTALTVTAAVNAASAPPVTLSPKEHEGRVQEILSFLQLEHKLSQPTDTLSYGQKRKLCLATAFVRNPLLLLLDEPFSGLDYPACEEVMAYIRHLLAQQTAVIISTHDTALVHSLAQRFLFLSPELPPFFGGKQEAVRQYGPYKLRPLIL